ncbi:7096_t:CDS:2, partial [Gigaspora rosea]
HIEQEVVTEQVLSDNNPYIEGSSKEKENKVADGEKDEPVSLQNNTEHNKENHVEDLTSDIAMVEEKELTNRQALIDKSQNIDEDGSITVTHKKKSKVKNQLPEASRIIGSTPYKKGQT